MSNELQKLADDSGLEKTKAQIILDKFKGFFDGAADWEKKAKEIVVTSEAQTSDMQIARVGRLELRKKRIDVENTRKDLKKDSLLEGQLIDGIAKTLKAVIQTTEQYLERQEKFVELKKKAEEDDKRREVEARMEEERIAEEKRQAEEQERVRKENEKLKKEAEVRERKLAEQRREADKKQRELEDKARKEREKSEAEKKAIEDKALEEARKKEKAHQEKLKKEAGERAKVEAELQAKKDAEAKAIREEAERIENEKTASDKDKLLKMARDIELIQTPTCRSKSAREILIKVEELLAGAIIILGGDEDGTGAVRRQTDSETD